MRLFLLIKAHGVINNSLDSKLQTLEEYERKCFPDMNLLVKEIQAPKVVIEEEKSTKIMKSEVKP